MDLRLGRPEPLPEPLPHILLRKSSLLFLFYGHCIIQFHTAKIVLYNFQENGPTPGRLTMKSNAKSDAV